MDAGAAVFADKGYEAATMSEIAARSATAIGSLYRFFPTKAVLADALLQRYSDALDARIAAVAARAAGLRPQEIAADLADAMDAAAADRAPAMDLIDVRVGVGDRRQKMREHVRRSIAQVLRQAAPNLDEARAMVLAAVVVQMLKSLRSLCDEPASRREAAVAEMRAALGLYLASRLACDA